MRKTVIFIILFSGVLSCAILRDPPGKQGIKGEVRWVEGNLMPMIGDTTYTSRSKGSPIQRDLHIFLALKRDDVQPTNGTIYRQINGALISQVKTDKDGTFQVEIPPGKYSVFTMEKEGYFANIFDGDGYINPVTVHEGEFTELQIVINYKAYY